MKEYAVFKYKSLIITKFDETSYIGNLFSIISETNIPITYITAGQEVPQDFMLADIETFLKETSAILEVVQTSHRHLGTLLQKKE